MKSVVSCLTVLMMRKRALYLILFLTSFCLAAVAQGTGDTLVRRSLTPNDMQADFAFLRRILTETHPALYRYNTKEEMQIKMDSIYSLLDRPMPFYDFHFLISGLISDIRCAHTYAIPVKNVESYYVNQIKTFPLMIFPIEDKFYVTVNGTSDKTIRPGFEILEINSRPIGLIRDILYRHIWADGYNKTLKAKTINEAYFPLFYYLNIERPESFLVKALDLNGKEVIVTVPAQHFRETQKMFDKNEVNKEIMAIAKSRNKLDKKKGWRLTIREKESTGVLRITGFGGGRDEKEARQKMHDFMEGCMKTLHEKNVKNLIIDLRYNGGGWDIQGVELYTYLMDKPTRCYRRLHSVTDSTEFLKLSDLSPEDLKQIKTELKKEDDGTFSVREDHSEQLKIQQPKPNRFAGTVYVLANGGSASTTSEFIAYAKSNGSIILIGDETGGAYEGGNGGSFLRFDLPHSKISVGTPLLYYDNAVTEPKQKGFGTKPDYYVPNKIENLRSGDDTQLNFTLELIKTKGQ